MTRAYLYTAALGFASLAFLAGCALTIAGGVIKLRLKASPWRSLRIAAIAFAVAVVLYVGAGHVFGGF